MAYSSVTYTGNGSTTSFAVPFSYLFQSDVSVTVNGTPAAFTWTNPALINITTAPVTGAAILIKRSTGIETLVVEFSEGSTVQASDINTDATQGLYLAQEAADGVSVAVTAAGNANTAAAAANAAVASLVPFTGDSGAGGTSGLVPAPGAGTAASGKFLSANGSWAVPPTAMVVGTNMVAAGADPTGVADSTSAFQTVLTATGATGGVIVIPPGRYKITSTLFLTVAAGKVVDIGGAAPDLTTLYTPTGSIFSVTLHDETAGINIHHMSLTTQVQNVGTAISVTETTSAAAPNGVVNNFTNLTIRGDDGYGGAFIFASAISIGGGVSYCNFTDIVVPGSITFAGNGINLQGDLTNLRYGVTYNFVNCTFAYINDGIVYGSYIQGVALVNCSFTGLTNGIVQPAGVTGPAFQLAVTSCQFACRVACITINVGILGVYLTGNEITGIANGWTGIAGVIGTASIVGNSFINTGYTGSIGIVTANGSNGVTMTANIFNNMTWGLIAQATTLNANLCSNVYIGVTNKSSPVSTSGTVVIGTATA